MTDQTSATPTCAKCGDAPAGLGGILCPDCLAAIAARRLDA
ncbi:hypothetical protein OHS58_48600 [Amycolatopsis sp. NBC_00348]|nr:MULTISPECIES: hypothetical protein [unclassified Amycolatopsis]